MKLKKHLIGIEDKMMHDLGHVPNIQRHHLPPDTHIVSLMHALGASLDADHIVSEFAEHLQHYVPYDGLRYECNTLGITLATARLAEHQIQYQLTYQDHDLGRIILSRAYSFKQNDIQQFEDLLCLLINPLKHAMLHYRAIQSALHDPLTGVLNRNAFQSTLKREVELAKRYQTDLSLLALDVDHFKCINDAFGHAAGDSLLQAFSRTVKEAARDTDLIFRVGGEEFIIILSKTNTHGATTIAERILAAVRSLEYTCDRQAMKTTVSIGLASLLPQDSEHSLIERADTALYRAKQTGRDRLSS